MSKENHIYKARVDYIQDNTPLLMKGWLFKELEGKLLTIIEAMGLSDKQENAVKSYVRKAVWGGLDEGCVVILSDIESDAIYAPLFSANQNVAVVPETK